MVEQIFTSIILSISRCKTESNNLIKTFNYFLLGNSSCPSSRSTAIEQHANNLKLIEDKTMSTLINKHQSAIQLSLALANAIIISTACIGDAPAMMTMV